MGDKHANTRTYIHPIITASTMTFVQTLNKTFTIYHDICANAEQNIYYFVNYHLAN